MRTPVLRGLSLDLGAIYLVRDNNRAYGHVFTSRVRAMGIRDRPISPGSPWQNGIAERLIGTLRRECLDHMAICGEAHLRRILSSYAGYYNQSARTWLYRKMHRNNGLSNSRQDHRYSRPGRSTSPIRPDMIFGKDRTFLTMFAAVLPLGAPNLVIGDMEIERYARTTPNK